MKQQQQLSDGWPWYVFEVSHSVCRFVNYLMLGNGSPVMRLKGGCLQVNNMLRNPHCSLFVQVHPPRHLLLPQDVPG